MFLRVLDTPLELVQHEQSAKRKNCNMQRVQQWEECKMKTLQLVKVHNEIVQNVKRVQDEKRAT